MSTPDTAEKGKYFTGHIYRRCPKCDGTGNLRVINPDALREDRVRRGLSVREVARRCGVSAAFVSDVETGRRNWSPRLAKGYPFLRRSNTGDTNG